jgi:hypothetical protein
MAASPVSLWGQKFHIAMNRGRAKKKKRKKGGGKGGDREKVRPPNFAS